MLAISLYLTYLMIKGLDQRDKSKARKGVFVIIDINIDINYLWIVCVYCKIMSVKVSIRTSASGPLFGQKCVEN